MDMVYQVGRWLPVLLTDNQGEAITGIDYYDTDLEVLFEKHNSVALAVTLTAENWKESAKGGYLVLASASDADTLGEFLYYASYPGAVTYPGVVDVVRSLDVADMLDFSLSGHEIGTLAGVLVTILEKIAGGTITTIAPVLADGTVVELIKGDDYSNDDGRALIWTESESGVWPDLTGATVNFIIPLPGDETTEIEGVVSESGGLQTVMFELDHTDTDGIGMEGNGLFWIKATLDGIDARVVTLAHGKVRVSNLTSRFR